MEPPRVGISACLLGERVRYDGGHKLNPFAAGPLGKLVTLVPVCPEVELGMGIPREPVRLERSRRTLRMVGTGSRTDHTAAMTRFARRRIDALESLGLSGYIFKKNSPSCGPEGVPVHGSTRTGRGLFAAAVIDRMPLLPVVDERDLSTAAAQGHFLERVFAYQRLRDFFGARWTAGGLARFHASEKPVLLAHDPAGCADLGRLVARAKSRSRSEVAAAYQERHMRALAKASSGTKLSRAARNTRQKGAK